MTPNRPLYCKVCKGPLYRDDELITIRSEIGTVIRVEPPRTRGRPRKTCSEACRAKLSRWTRGPSKGGTRQPDPKWDRKTYAARKTIREWERRFGKFDMTFPEWGKLTLRDRFELYLQRGWEIPFCELCHKPFLHDIPGAGKKTCSRKCTTEMNNYHRIVKKMMDKYHFDGIHKNVYVRMKLGVRVALCVECGFPFPPYDVRKKYCSAKCRQRAYYKRWGWCKWCGEKFPRPVGVGMRKKYCSDECKELAHNLRRQQQYQPVVHHPRICPECGETFTPLNGNQRRCSRRCTNVVKTRRRRLRQQGLLPPPRPTRRDLPPEFAAASTSPLTGEVGRGAFPRPGEGQLPAPTLQTDSRRGGYLRTLRSSRTRRQRPCPPPDRHS